ncbi:hypothetical protein C8J57DRAFT_1300949 [Mycena rebaudengoi]|nr:hypothetical protein C8J57DRAFT_1300949 [Mycena rebaudengoi]
MTPASALVALLLLIGAASLHVPGCLPDEDATIVSEAMFEVPDIVVMPFRFKNLTITHFTCPSRQSLAQRKPSERRDLQSGIRTGGTHHNLERQTPTPIQLCGIMGGSELFKSKFNCDQSSGNEPTLSDCGIFATEVIDSFVRPMMVNLPPRAGLVISLFNNTCAFVFLNDDVKDTYATCVESITDIFDNMANKCHSRRDGFIGSVQSRHSPGHPSMFNWAVNIVSASSLDN